MNKNEFLKFRDFSNPGFCHTCIHDERCGEIGGHQEARGFGFRCHSRDSEPRYRHKQGLKPVPGDPDQCPMLARTCAKCEHIEACMASTEADFKKIEMYSASGR